MSTYITVKYECNYTQSDWHIKGVHTDLDDALYQIFGLLLDELSTDYKIAFYKDRTTEFANLTGLSNYFIEHWENNRKIKTLTIGYQDRPYRHTLDLYLKQHHDTIDSILDQWQSCRLNLEIPPDFQQFISTSKYNQ